jgi:hypothetical protein
MPHAQRGPTLLDAMLLVGAIATGFGLLGQTWPGFWPSHGYSWPGQGSSLQAYIGSAARQAIGAGPPVLSTLTFGIVAVGLRRTKPRLRRIRRQPGLAACFATLPAFIMLTAGYVLVNATPGRSMDFWYAMVLLSYLAGPAVAGAWITLALHGRWRSSTSWVDGLGVAVGVCWITLTILALYSLRR